MGTVGAGVWGNGTRAARTSLPPHTQPQQLSQKPPFLSTKRFENHCSVLPLHPLQLTPIVCHLCLLAVLQAQSAIAGDRQDVLALLSASKMVKAGKKIEVRTNGYA